MKSCLQIRSHSKVLRAQHTWGGGGTTSPRHAQSHCIQHQRAASPYSLLSCQVSSASKAPLSPFLLLTDTQSGPSPTHPASTGSLPPPLLPPLTTTQAQVGRPAQLPVTVCPRAPQLPSLLSPFQLISETAATLIFLTASSDPFPSLKRGNKKK